MEEKDVHRSTLRCQVVAIILHSPSGTTVGFTTLLQLGIALSFIDDPKYYFKSWCFQLCWFNDQFLVI